MPNESTQAQSQNSNRKTWILTGLGVVAILAITAGVIYWYMGTQYVYIDTSSVQAPLIQLAPSQQGILNAVYVNEGDSVDADQTVALVGNELVKSKVAGVIVSVPATIGAVVNPNQAVATMIDPTQLRIVGKIDENKGLDRIQVGDPISFTVDAFGSKQYSGVVDEISPTANQSGVVFNISSQRAVQQFNVKARFDVGKYPEIKNGMSARMWVYTQ